MQMSEYRYDIPSLPFLWRVYVKMSVSYTHLTLPTNVNV